MIEVPGGRSSSLSFKFELCEDSGNGRSFERSDEKLPGG